MSAADGPGPALRAIAFDLDGTLVDTAPDIQHALNNALARAGLQTFDLDTVRAWIGDGPDALIGRALAQQGLIDADDALRVQLRRRFDVSTLSAPLGLGNVYAGIGELIARLRRDSAALPLVVVTNKPTPLARAVLDAAELLPFFDAVHGADTPPQRKPSPLLLREASARLGVATGEMVMVGDSLLDMQAAEAAGCTAALAGWGYGAHTVPDWLASWRLKLPGDLLDHLAAQAPACVAATAER